MLLRSLILELLFFACGYAFSYDNPERNTEYGKVRGKITSRYLGRHVEEYLGVPYAAPPVGDLRFKRSQPPKPWHYKTLETKSLPPACPTKYPYYVQYHKAGFNDSNEDCLYMNIYVPKAEGRKLFDVLLFIHGGSNVDGMGAMFDGDLLAAHGNMIVITFNYRISMLGFYANPSLGIKGNNGLMDQVLAMKWVQNNIHFFGGDRHRVTLHGHSAGAGDVGLHLMSDLSQGLFRNVIINSGSPLGYWMLSDCVRSMRTLQKPKECKDGFSILKGNAAVAIEELLAGSHIDDFFSKITYEEHVAHVVVDGEFLKDSPAKLLSCGKFNVDNVLLITTKDEGVMAVPSLLEEFYYNERNISNFIEERENLFPEKKDTFKDDVLKTVEKWEREGSIRFPEYLHLSSDIAVFSPMVMLADFLRKKSDDLYWLSFEYLAEKYNGPKGIEVQHGWDLFYVFGTPLIGHYQFPFTPRDVEVSKETMTIISNFVKHGHLIFNHKKMQKYSSRRRTYNRLSYAEGKTKVTMEDYFRKPNIEFWNKYLNAYDQFECTKF